MLKTNRVSDGRTNRRTDGPTNRQRDLQRRALQMQMPRSQPHWEYSFSRRVHACTVGPSMRSVLLLYCMSAEQFMPCIRPCSTILSGRYMLQNHIVVPLRIRLTLLFLELGLIPASDSLDDGVDNSRDSPKTQNHDEFEAQNRRRRLRVEEGDVQTPGHDYHESVKDLTKEY